LKRLQPDRPTFRILEVGASDVLPEPSAGIAERRQTERRADGRPSLTKP
jgi:hypothetical protein